MPDLQGEFLRGTGTNSHTNQGSGASVGVHQDGTLFPDMEGGSDGKVYLTTGTKASYDSVKDSTVASGSYSGSGVGGVGSSADWRKFTSRPTNTSFLICVKAVVAGEVYSTEERVVGTWIDGKKIYQKTYVGLSIAIDGNWKSTGILIPNIERIKRMQGELSANSISFSTTIYSKLDSGSILIDVPNMNGTVVNTLTIQYTKTTD